MTDLITGGPNVYDCDRVIQLTHGAGNGVDKACLMTASNMLVGRGQDGDDNSCVCPLLRAFIIKTNDAMPESLLGELYGPLAWEILGTRNDDPEVIQARTFAFADWAVREIAPLVLWRHPDQAARLRALAPVTDKATATYAGDAAAYAATNAADANADANAYAAAYAADYAATNAADANAYAATNAADAAAIAAAIAAESSAAVWRLCPAIIRRVAAIGDRRPVECVITARELEAALAGERP